MVTSTSTHAKPNLQHRSGHELQVHERCEAEESGGLKRRYVDSFSEKGARKTVMWQAANSKGDLEYIHRHWVQRPLSRIKSHAQISLKVITNTLATNEGGERELNVQHKFLSSFANAF